LNDNIAESNVIKKIKKIRWKNKEKQIEKNNKNQHNQKIIKFKYIREKKNSFIKKNSSH
jgi:hypothetical protein